MSERIPGIKEFKRELHCKLTVANELWSLCNMD
jgi:hypothetical protein